MGLPKIPSPHRGVDVRKIHAVVDDKRSPGVHPGLHHHIPQLPGDANPIIQLPQRRPIGSAISQIAQGAAQVIQLGITVDRGDHRRLDPLFQQIPHEIGPGAVAMDDLEVLRPDQLLQAANDPGNVPTGQHLGGNAHFPGLLGKGPLHKADQQHPMGLIQALQQGQHMGFRAAYITAGYQMYDSHNRSSPHPGHHSAKVFSNFPMGSQACISRRRARLMVPSCMWLIQARLLPQP